MTTTISGSNGIVFPDDTSMQTGQQAVKAWVNFNGTGVVAIRAGYNVSSITDLNTGKYQVNFTTAFPDINYAAVAMIRADTDYGPLVGQPHEYATQSTTAIRLKCGSSSVAQDSSVVSVAIFR
mgnify:CR=1 FL=1